MTTSYFRFSHASSPRQPHIPTLPRRSIHPFSRTPTFLHLGPPFVIHRRLPRFDTPFPPLPVLSCSPPPNLIFLRDRRPFSLLCRSLFPSFHLLSLRHCRPAPPSHRPTCFLFLRRTTSKSRNFLLKIEAFLSSMFSSRFSFFSFSLTDCCLLPPT